MLNSINGVSSANKTVAFTGNRGKTLVTSAENMMEVATKFQNASLAGENMSKNLTPIDILNNAAKRLLEAAKQFDSGNYEIAVGKPEVPATPYSTNLYESLVTGKKMNILDGEDHSQHLDACGIMRSIETILSEDPNVPDNTLTIVKQAGKKIGIHDPENFRVKVKYDNPY